MPTTPSTIAREIANFSPDDGDWGRLDVLVQGLWSVGRPGQHLSELFGLFERFPANEDGNGVFWTILHGIEALDDYEQELAASLDRRPSEFAVLLAGRMLNAGVKTLGAIPLVQALTSVATSPLCPASVAETAERFLRRSRG